MLFAAHSITSGAIGKYTGNPILAFLAGFLIHFLLDAIPHYDSTDGGKLTKRQLALIFVDFVFTIGILFFVIKPDLTWKNPYWWGIFGGELPDFLDNVPFWDKAFQRTKFGKKFHQFHEKIQEKNIGAFWGITVQVVLVIIFGYLSMR